MSDALCLLPHLPRMSALVCLQMLVGAQRDTVHTSRLRTDLLAVRHSVCGPAWLPACRGGIVKGPLMLELGVLPDVSAAPDLPAASAERHPLHGCHCQLHTCWAPHA